MAGPVNPAVQSYQTSEARPPQLAGPSVVEPVLSPAKGPAPEMAVAVAQLSLPPLTKPVWLGPLVGTTGLAGVVLRVPKSGERGVWTLAQLRVRWWPFG